MKTPQINFVYGLSVRVLQILCLLLLIVLLLWLGWRPGLAEYAQHRVRPASAQSGGLSATWFGVSAVLLRVDGHAVFIDPFFSRPGGALKLLANRPIEPDVALIRRWLRRAGVERLDAVLVSHSHYDHAMDAGVVADLTGALVLGSSSTLNIARGAGVPEARLQLAEPQESWTFGPLRVRFIESRHAGASGGRPTGEISAPLRTPARVQDYRLGGTYSIVVEHPDGTLVHHGSAGFVPGALRAVAADVVFLGVALIDDLDAYLAETVYASGADTVYPVHWDDFTRPLDRPLTPLPFAVRLDRFFAALRQHPELRVYGLNMGVPVTLFDPPRSVD